MLKETALNDFFADLRRETGGDIRTDEVSRTLYSTDASIYQVMPLGVCFPRSQDEVAAIMSLADRYQIPILPRAGGTSLAGQTTNEALVIDFSHHMAEIVEVNREESWVKVQPGMVHANLNRRLQPYGLMFGPDPASGNRAGMGGIVGNNATGSHSIRYGMAVDHVMETDVVLSDGTAARFGSRSPAQIENFLGRDGLEGEIYRKLFDISQYQGDVIRAGTPKHWRRCGGYNLFRFVDGVPESPYTRRDVGQFNLAQLMSGSEGTLGIMTEFKLNLVPVPKKTALAIVHFDDPYLGLDATQIILETNPSAVELLDHLTMRLSRTQPKFRAMLETFIEGDPQAVLVTEYYGESDAELKHKLDQLEAHLKKRGVGYSAIVPLLTPEVQAPVWKVRKAGLGLLMSRRGDFKPIAFIEDTAVPVQYLAQHISRLVDFCRDLDVEMAYYAHASGGCLHVRPLINTKDQADLDKMYKISRFTLKLMHEYGGSFSSEHGDGRARSWLNEALFGPELFQLFCDVKQTFDPKNLLNPGNVVNGASMTEDLRFGSDYVNISLQEKLNFKQDQGFHRAIEMCNGAGICRKQTGTMCPPYMVTKEEEHSTRGRANMLRAALTGKIPAERLSEKRMYETMDLCVSCKACKTECPSSVDMAKIKMEFLYHYYEKNGTPFRARLFGNIHRINRIVSGPLAPLANWAAGLPVSRWANERFLGVGKSRTLPPFSRENFLTWFKKRPKSRNHINRKKPVVFFNDTFNTYNDPHIAQAAVEVLEAAGYEPILPGHTCCGRPMLSKGLLDGARALAEETINKLYPFAADGIPIVGLEPSCLLSFRDDYHYLLSEEMQQKVKVVSEQSFLFEEFVAKEADAGQLELTFKSEEAGREVLLHGHCHQKSLAGTETAHKILSLPGYRVHEVDSGCCGMAGSFGYEAEHVEISLKMGERALFPAVRATDDQTIIAAAGTSCRDQIRDGTARRAKHPAEILRDALADEG